MTHSGFKTSQKRVNIEKKENNNKDYKCKQKIKETFRFSSKVIPIDYILQTKYGICLNEKNKNYINNNYSSYRINIANKNPILNNFIYVLQNQLNLTIQKFLQKTEIKIDRKK